MSGQPGMRFDDRVYVVGDTGSGKSELLNYLHGQVRAQKLLIDTKSEFSIPGVQPATTADRIDWREPFIHFQDEDGELAHYDDVFRLALQRRRPLSICVHELADLCGDQPGATPRWVAAAFRKGRAWGVGILGGSQRPVGMPRVARALAQHVIAFVPQLDPPDHKLVAEMMRLSPDELSAKLDEATALSPTGEYSYVWRDRRSGITKLGPPLPEKLRRSIAVRRLTD